MKHVMERLEAVQLLIITNTFRLFGYTTQIDKTNKYIKVSL